MDRIQAETEAMCQRLARHAPGLQWEGTHNPYILVLGHIDQGYRGKSPTFKDPQYGDTVPMNIDFYWDRNKKGWEPRFNGFRFTRERFASPEEAVDAALAYAKEVAMSIIGFYQAAKETS